VGFAVSLILRLCLAATRAYFSPPEFGEVINVAKHIITQGPYANPYGLPTGPTAHPAPVDTYALAGLFAVFGMTPIAEAVRVILNILAGRASQGPGDGAFGNRGQPGWRKSGQVLVSGFGSETVTRLLFLRHEPVLDPGTLVAVAAPPGLSALLAGHADDPVRHSAGLYSENLHPLPLPVFWRFSLLARWKSGEPMQARRATSGDTAGTTGL
jgi:hypothetical protein